MVKLVKKIVTISMVLGIMMFSLTGCGEAEINTGIEVEEAEVPKVTEENTDIFSDTGFSTFTLSSDDLHEGVWDTVITNTDNGLNVSPQLAWEAVPGAGCYVIYMVDTTVEDWIHWKSNNVTETNLPQGWAPKEEYIGPYPPGGTHDYEIYVFALKEPVERAKGAFNNSNMKFKANALALDSVTEGTSGNILAYGHITGTYTKGD